MIHFKKSPENPIYGGPATGTLFDVYVTKERADGPYRMDLSWRPKKALAVTYSIDGIHFGEMQITLSHDPESGWEDNINRNGVLKIGDTYRMWYTGQARGYSFIGLAESSDGEHFTRIGSEPVLIPERHWEGMSVMNPCVLYENGIYRMWYAAGETYEPNVIAYAESDDGITWRKSKINPIVVKNPGKEYEQDRIGGCQVLKHPTLGYLMFYIGYRDINTACICAAASKNGITGWKRCKANPLVTPDKGMWDEDSCYKPSAYYDAEKNTWQIWYNGRKKSDEYIGTAIAEGDFTLDDFED
ncbi:MAG: hypothetical protein MJ175_07215 [Clostridia bacterium]|nr:hypothetical protein [Clostridia bacterium]